MMTCGTRGPVRQSGRRALDLDRRRALMLPQRLRSGPGMSHRARDPQDQRVHVWSRPRAELRPAAKGRGSLERAGGAHPGQAQATAKREAAARILIMKVEKNLCRKRGEFER